MGPVKSTSTNNANDPKAANVAVCGSPITLSAKAKTAGMTNDARVACISAARPGSVRRSCGIASRRLRLISPSSGEADPRVRGRSATASILSGCRFDPSARGGAVPAGAPEDDVVAGDRIPGPALDLVQGALELVVGEGLDLAAVVADEVMMMLAVGVDRLEAGRAGADVDPLDEPVLAQLLEYAVDARDSDPAALGSELVEDLLGGQAAVLTPEQLDDCAAGAAVAVPLRMQRGDRRLGPGRLGHGANGSASRMQIVERMSIVSVWPEYERLWPA